MCRPRNPKHLGPTHVGLPYTLHPFAMTHPLGCGCASFFGQHLLSSQLHICRPQSPSKAHRRILSSFYDNSLHPLPDLPYTGSNLSFSMISCSKRIVFRIQKKVDPTLSKMLRELEVSSGARFQPWYCHVDRHIPKILLSPHL